MSAPVRPTRPPRHPALVASNSVMIASLLDLAGTKAKALLDRIERKDYRTSSNYSTPPISRCHRLPPGAESPGRRRPIALPASGPSQLDNPADPQAWRAMNQER